MKRLVLLAVVGSIAFVGCKKEDEGNKNVTVVNDEGKGVLEPSQTQRALVIEYTGIWCGFCPNGAEALIEAEHVYGNKMIAMAIHVREDDPLENQTGLTITSSLPIHPGLGLWVGNTAGVSGSLNTGAIETLIAQSPVAAVGHSWTANGSTINVEARVKFYAEDIGEYLVGCYFLQGDIAASFNSAWGNLIQTDYTNRLEVRLDGEGPNGEGDATSFWTVDAAYVNGTALIKADSRYLHSHVLSAHAGDNVFGKQITTAPAIWAGEEFNFDFSISTTSQMKTEGGHVVTVLWKKKTTSSTYEFVNAYKS